MSVPKVIIDAGDGRRWESILPPAVLEWLIEDARRMTLEGARLATAAGLAQGAEDRVSPADVAGVLIERQIAVLRVVKQQEDADGSRRDP